MRISDWSSDVCSSDLLAVKLLIDGKVSRPSACNSLETLLVHQDIAPVFLPLAARALLARGVELRGDEATRRLVAEAKPASDEDYAAEFLDQTGRASCRERGGQSV